MRCKFPAEGESVLLRTLARLLEQTWPELCVVGVAEDGMRSTTCSARHGGTAATDRGAAESPAGQTRQCDTEATEKYVNVVTPTGEALVRRYAAA